MTKMQELRFKLDSGEEALGFIYDLWAIGCAASLNEAGSGSLGLMYWLAIPTRSTASDAFDAIRKLVISRAAAAGKKLVAIDNPNNCELLTAVQQRTMAGQQISVSVNGK